MLERSRLAEHVKLLPVCGVCCQRCHKNVRLAANDVEKKTRTLKHTFGTHARKLSARMRFSGPLTPRLPTMCSTWPSTEQQHDATRNESEKTTPKGLACLNVQSWLNLSNYSCLCCFKDVVKRTLKDTLGTHARKLLAWMPLSGPLRPRLPTMSSAWQCTEQQHDAT